MNPIIKTLQQFATSFDTKNWTLMKACLADEIYTDYSSFRKTKPAIIKSTDYIALRKIGLENLRTHHSYADYEIEVNGEEIFCNCSFEIQRFSTLTNDFYHSYGKYEFELEEIGGEWKIVKIKQIVERNEGNPQIHGAFKK
ncbi:MAG: nuclear transport factor 2 family protein [Chitinophagales bacterium]